MAWLVLIAGGMSMALATLFTFIVRGLSRRWGHLDSPGVPGQVKAPTRRVPNTGGVAIFWALALPLGAILLAGALGTERMSAWLDPVFPGASVHLEGVRTQTPAALTFLALLLVLHVMGLVDDRRPLGPWVKMLVMLACAAALVLGTGSRLLTALDASAGGPWLSIVVTVLWIVVVTNALNFMDNMDGLSAGVSAIAGTCFLAAALVNTDPQWFVGGMLALLVGACAGFLVFNYPRSPARDGTPRGATIFMGDGGSLVLGFTLAFLTVRTTYYSPAAAGGWYAVLMPLVVLAVPLYDFVSVSLIRLRAGKSPLVGDLNHLSHRLTRRGLSRRDAVLTIYGLTAITAIGGVLLAHLQPWQAMLVGGQVLLVLGLVALVERRTGSPAAAGDAGAGGSPSRAASAPSGSNPRGAA